MTRILTAGSLLLTFAAAATADFDGPAPLAWRFVQPTTVSPGGSPVVDGNTIYQSIGGRVFSIDRETGNLKWRFPQVDPIEGAFRSSPLLAPGALVVAGDNKLIYGVNPQNGQLLWSYPTGIPVYGQPTLVGTTVVYATSDNKLHAIGAADGKEVWSTPYSVHDGIAGTIAGWNNSVMFFNSRSQLTSIDLTTRNRNWTQNFTQLPPNPVPVIYGDSIFTVSGPFVIAINPQSGSPRWQIQTGAQLSFPPAVSQEGIYVVSQDGKLFAYQHNRDKINKYPVNLGTSAVTRPTASGKYVIIPTTAGGVMIVDPTKMVIPAGTAPGAPFVDPSPQAILWNYLIRPINASASRAASGSSGSPNGPGGPPGGQTQQGDVKIVTIQANAPVVVAGDTLLIAAKDGSLLAFDKNLGVDLTPPTVKMFFPNPGDQVSGQPPLLLAFKVEDIASGLDTKTIKVDIEGQEYETTLNAEGILIVRFSLTGKNRPLGDGRKTINVTAVDWMGNVAKQSFALTIDNTLKPIVLPGTNNSGSGGGAGGGFGGGGGGAGGGL
ncbi:MAG: PQQ-binding-like beta-propeller repeat protein [Fimbriimonas sp.]